MTHSCTRSRAVAITFLFASFILSSCTSMGDATLGGRPLVYKNAPADEVEIKAGVVTKRSSTEAERAPVRAASAPQPAPAPRHEGPSVVAQSQPALRPSTAIASESEFLNRYTQASRYGDLLFVSGQIAVDPRTGDFDASQNIEAQTRRVLENIRAILEANRLTMANVVSTTVYLSSISRLAAMDAVYHGFFRGTPPARTVVEVANLPRAALVEISVVAGR